MRKVSSKVMPKRNSTVRFERFISDLGPEETYSSNQIRVLINDLLVHQTELQAQNEELQRAHAELEESRNRYYILYNSSPVFYLSLDKDGLVTEINLTGTTMLGLERDLIIGRPFWQFILSEDRPNCLDLIEKARFTGVRQMGEVRVLQGLREARHVSMEITPREDSEDNGTSLQVSLIDITDRKRIEEELCRYSEDLEYIVRERTIELEERNLLLQEEISERKRYEKALRESEEKYRQLVENANEAIVVIQNGMLCFINHKASEFSGYTEEELASIPFAELIHPDDRDMVVDRYQRRLRGEEVLSSYDFRMVDKNKNTKWLEVNNIGISWQGRPATLNFLMDITDWKKTEQEKELVVEQLLQSQKMEALGRFAGGIAHDLNNILYPIVVNTETLLGDAVQGSESHQMLQEVLDAAYRQKDLVKQILSFSRRSEQKFSPIKIVPLIQETIKFIRSSLPSSIEIWSHVSARTDAIMGDSTQILQVIMNLCKNAADALKSRKGLIEISLDEETVSNHPDMKRGDYLRLSVRDTGCGMEPDMLDKIFEPFFTTKTKDKGIGMGLPVVHGIIENHEGAITAKSEPGKGSEFIVYLPKYRGEMLKQATLFENDMLPEGRKKILLVDDEETIINSLQRALQKTGFDVVAEKDATRALVLFNRSPHEFNLVITDLTMPQITGVEFAEKLMDVRPDIPVILCTGLSEGVDEKRMKAAGIREILMKPANLSELRDAVHRAFEN